MFSWPPALDSVAGFEFDGEQEVWELYHVAKDFSQSVDLAAKHPEKLRQLQDLFEQAERYGVYPLRDASGRRGGDYAPPHSLEGHSKMTYGPMHVRLPEHGVINLKNTSFRITDAVETGEASTGVIACQGGNMAGWSLYLDDESRPTYVYNWFGHEFTTLTGKPFGPGEHGFVSTILTMVVLLPAEIWCLPWTGNLLPQAV